MVFIPRLLTALLAILGLWVLGAAAESNAQRLQKGLPPNPPRPPSRVYSADRRQASPGVNPTGYITVTANDGSFSGWIANYHSSSGGNVYTYTTSLSSALLVSLPSTAYQANTYFALTEVTPIDAGYSYVGVAAGSAGSYFAPSKLGYAYFTGSQYLAPGTPAGAPTARGGSTGETSIWTFVPNTLTFSIQWTNTDSTTATAQPYYKIQGTSFDYIGISGDLTYLKAHVNPSASYIPLTFGFQPI